jgi:polysaccharide chain length determinant protein (PEP-CTERM system associated)
MPSSSTPAVLQYLDALRRRWRIVAVTTAVVFSVLGPIAFGLPNLYRSRALLLVDQLPSSLTTSDRVGEVDARLQAIKQEALSRQRLIQLVERFNLYPKLRAAGQLDDVIFQAQHDVSVDIASSVQTNGNPNTVAFTVSYLGTTPETAAAVANDLAAFYVQQNDAMRSRHASETTSLLKSELDATRQRLAAQEQRVISFSSSNSGALPQQLNSTMTKYTQLSTALQAATTDEMRMAERRDSLQNQIAELMTPKLNTNSTDPRVQLAQARRELATLRLNHTENHPDVKAKEAEIATLEAQAKERGTAEASTESSQVTTLQQQLAGVNARIAELDKQKTELQNSLSRYDSLLSAAPVRDAQFETLSRDLDSTRTQLDGLQKRYQEALLNERAEGAGGEEFHVVDPAVPTRAPSSPGRMLLVAGALGVAFVLGIVLAFIRDRFDDSFQSIDDLRAFTRVPVLAAIPAMRTRRERIRRGALSVATTAATCAVLWIVCVQVFYVAQRSEAVARMLVR